MKKYMVYIGMMLLVLCSILLGNKIIPLFGCGITVKYQRATGPEFIVLRGEESIKKMSDSTDGIVYYSEVFVKNDLDTDVGFLNPRSNYIVCGDYCGSKAIVKGGNLYPVIKVTHILSEKEYYFRGFLFVIVLLSLILSVTIAFFR